MNENLEHALRTYHESFNLNYSEQRQSLLAELAQRATARKPARVLPRPGWMVRTVAGLAVGIVVALALSFGLLGAPQTLYAKVAEKLENARTVHIAVYKWEKMKPGMIGEVWYERDHGVREWVAHRGRVDVRVDDGTHQWHHRKGETSAFRSRSSDPVGMAVAKTLEMEKLRRVLNDARHDPAEKRRIDGVDCALYVRKLDSEGYRDSLWIDDQHRLRRVEKHESHDGEWVQTELIDVSYDQPIAANLLEPNFGDAVSIVDIGKLLDENFSVSQAMFSKDVMGLTVAIHELAQVAENSIFVVHSTRATKETLDRFGKIQSVKEGRHHQGATSWGSFSLYNPGHRNTKGEWYGWAVVQLATFDKDGMRIDWSLLHRVGEWPEDNRDRYEHAGILRPGFKLHEARLKEGLPEYEAYRPLVTLDLPKDSVSLEDALTTVHRDTRLLESIAFQLDLHVGEAPFTDAEIDAHVASGASVAEARKLKHVLNVAPSGISEQDYVTKMKAQWNERFGR